MSYDTIVIDGNNLASRCHHAMTLTNSEGESTSVLFGVINSLVTYINQYSPKRMVICWDGGKAQWRMDLFSGYKESRHQSREMSSEEEKQSYERYLKQINLVREILENCPILQMKVSGVEADDLIAFECLSKEPLEKVLIVSMDEDFFQLVTEDVHVFSPSKAQIITGEWIFERNGIWPSEFSIYKALIGDGSDEIPGFPNIGPKTAQKIIRLFNPPESEDIDTYTSQEALDLYPQMQRCASLNSSTVSDLRRNYMMMDLSFGVMHLMQDHESSVIQLKSSPLPRFHKSAVWQSYSENGMVQFLSKFEEHERLWKTLERPS